MEDKVRIMDKNMGGTPAETEAEGVPETFLLEIGLEELPAQFAESAAEQLAVQACQVLGEWGFSYGELRSFVTPRRLALLVQGLPGRQPDLVEEVKGPKSQAAYDSRGEPTKALLGFMRGQGVTGEDIFKRELAGAEYVYARKFKPGQQTEALLPDLMARVIGSLSFTKPMRWGDLTLRFARPVRWLVALYGDRVVPFRFAGLTTGRTTRGHRTLGGFIRLNSGDEYIEALRSSGVVVDQEERKSSILTQMAELEYIAGGKAEADEGLLAEVVHLVEFPTVFCGKVNDKYLSLPEEVIATPMKLHQRYFPVRDAEGRLCPVFFGVRNGGTESLEVVVQGNERVLKARLEDAAFYYREDANRSLEDYVRDLDGVGYHDKLGTVGRRVGRLRRLAGILAGKAALTPPQKEAVSRAALLAKADLVTKMVYDFPELQGIMGGYYARLQGDSEEVALAIREHYKPRGAGDELPRSLAGRVLSMADRLDALAGFFGVGIQPTGSQDPFALRRQAQGLVTLLMDEDTPVRCPLAELLQAAFEGFIEQEIFEEVPDSSSDRGRILRAVEDFCMQRVRYAWLEKHVPYDVVDAVLARAEYPYGNICLTQKGLYSLAQQAHALNICRDRSDFVRFLNGYTRCVNLSRKEAPGLKEASDLKDRQEPWDDKLLKLLSHDAEKALLAALDRTEPSVSACLEADDYSGAFNAGMDIVPSIEALFDAVMIMDPDPEVKQARLALLRRCAAALGCLGDLTQLAQ
jgi:glycyl-tRNA synthetase beta chain